MMVPDTSTILAKQDFAALSTVTAAPFGPAGSGSSAAARLGRESRQNISAAIRRASVSEWSRARRMVIFVSFPVSGLNRYQKPDGAPSAKKSRLPMSPLRQADGLRQRRLHRQRNGGEFVGAGDMPRDRGID